jgi:hypothetical protein
VQSKYAIICSSVGGKDMQDRSSLGRGKPYFRSDLPRRNDEESMFLGRIEMITRTLLRMMTLEVGYK